MSSHLDRDQAARAASGAISLLMSARDSLGVGDFIGSREVALPPLPPLPLLKEEVTAAAATAVVVVAVVAAAVAVAASDDLSSPPMDDRKRLLRCVRGEVMVEILEAEPTETDLSLKTSGRSSSSATTLNVALLILFLVLLSSLSPS